MTKFTLASAVLIAAAIFTTEAMAARGDVAMRHARAHASAMGCVRAPNVGAFASDPYKAPPCMPGTTTTDTVQ